jgi:hypothetical protein
LFRGLFSSLDIEKYISPIAGLLVPFWVNLGCPKAPKQHKNYFVVVLDYFFYKNKPNDSVRGLFSSLDQMPYG